MAEGIGIQMSVHELKRTNTLKTGYAGYLHILDNSGQKIKHTCMTDLNNHKDDNPFTLISAFHYSADDLRSCMPVCSHTHIESSQGHCFSS